MTPDEVLHHAAQTIAGDRQDDYGDAAHSFQRIAALWTTLLGVPVEPWQVAQMMAALKLSRITTSPEKTDSWVDLAGYAALGATLAPRGEAPLTSTDIETLHRFGVPRDLFEGSSDAAL